jgi:hypothetical protein
VSALHFVESIIAAVARNPSPSFYLVLSTEAERPQYSATARSADEPSADRSITAKIRPLSLQPLHPHKYLTLSEAQPLLVILSEA